MSEELIIPFNIKEPQKRNTKLESAVTIDKIMELPSYQLGTPIWGVSIHYYHRQAEVVFLGQVTKDMITSRLSSKVIFLLNKDSYVQDLLSLCLEILFHMQRLRLVI